jgi:hypothetical protein
MLLAGLLLAPAAGGEPERAGGAGWGGGVTVVTNCSVVIAGGSTAALAAAVASAKEGVRTCLLEPTDWPGGQMTSAGVPAIDFNNAAPLVDRQGNALNVSFASHHRANHAPEFFALLDSITTTGRCSVSSKCYLPKRLLAGGLRALLARPAIAAHLVVYLLAVPVRAAAAAAEPGAVDSLRFVQRRPLAGAACGGWDQPLSQTVADWYGAAPSPRFGKRVLEFRAPAGGARPVFVDATEWGELLALLDAPHLLGLSEAFDGDVSGAGPRGAAVGNDQCGQSFSVTLAATLHGAAQREAEAFAPMPRPEYEHNCDDPATCGAAAARPRPAGLRAQGRAGRVGGLSGGGRRGRVHLEAAAAAVRGCGGRHRGGRRHALCAAGLALVLPLQGAAAAVPPPPAPCRARLRAHPPSVVAHRASLIQRRPAVLSQTAALKEVRPQTRAGARAEAAAGWAGGLNRSVLALAEREALGWYGWLRAHAGYGANLTLRDGPAPADGSPVGTCTGLMKARPAAPGPRPRGAGALRW